MIVVVSVSVPKCLFYHLQLNVALYFPRVWNSTQRWDMQLTISQVEISILFYYVDFVNGKSFIASFPASPPHARENVSWGPKVIRKNCACVGERAWDRG